MILEYVLGQDLTFRHEIKESSNDLFVAKDSLI